MSGFFGWAYLGSTSASPSRVLTRQPDILEYGRILSHAVIYIFNLLGILLWLICTTSISLSAVVAALLVRTVAAYSAVVNLLVRAVAGVIKQFS